MHEFYANCYGWKVSCSLITAYLLDLIEKNENMLQIK